MKTGGVQKLAVCKSFPVQKLTPLKKTSVRKSCVKASLCKSCVKGSLCKSCVCNLFCLGASLCESRGPVWSSG